MSMMNASYRRDQATVRVPVVMPVVEVTIDEEGRAAVSLNGEPYSVAGQLTRADVARVLDQITSELGTAVRAEVIECDGERFTDYITHTTAPATASVTEPTHRKGGPAADAPSPSPRPPDPAAGVRPLSFTPFGIAGSGFAAGEEVVVCVVITTLVADDEGKAFVRVPPALLTAHPDVVLVGTSTGTAACGNAAAPASGDADSA